MYNENNSLETYKCSSIYNHLYKALPSSEVSGHLFLYSCVDPYRAVQSANTLIAGEIRSLAEGLAIIVLKPAVSVGEILTPSSFVSLPRMSLLGINGSRRPSVSRSCTHQDIALGAVRLPVQCSPTHDCKQTGLAEHWPKG